MKGFTLIEMVIVIVILGILAAISGVFLQEGLNNYSTNQYITEASSQLRIALETMTRRIREVPSTSSITTASATRLTFTDFNSNTIDYQFSGTNLTLNSNNLITGLSAAGSSFSYLDQNLSTTATIANIRYIVITLALAQNNVSYTARTIIYPRNIA